MAVDRGIQLTDVQLRALDKRLMQIYQDALQQALARERAALSKLAAFDVLQYPSMTYEQIQAQRLIYLNSAIRETDLVNHIAEEIAHGGTLAALDIQRTMGDAFGINLDWGRYTVDRQSGVFLNWPMLDRRTIEIIMRNGQSPFTQIAFNKLGQDVIITQRLQNELIQAMLLGESRAQLVKRIQNVTGQSLSQARRVAQTEVVRVQSQARFEAGNEAIDMGIGMQKQWISRMDSHVRDTHAAQTGEIVDYDEAFSNGLMYPGDENGEPAETINCRCVLKDMVKNVPDSVKRYREQMQQNYGFDRWRELRAAGGPVDKYGYYEDEEGA